MAIRAIGTSAGAASRLRLRDAARLRRYRQYQDFYDGRHFEGVRNGRSGLVLNYARAIVDKSLAYLLGRGMTWSVLPLREDRKRDRARAEEVEQALYDVGWENHVDAVDLQVAQNASVLGDGVYKVLWDPARERVRILSVDPRAFFGCWAGDDPGLLRRVEAAYRLGAEDLALGGYGLTAEQAQGLVGSDPSASSGQALVDVVERWTPSELEILVRDQPIRRGPNPYGVIPFVHVPNLPAANESWGVSDLIDVIPINREIDERVSDQADVIRFHADPPIVFRGVSDHGDLAVGPGTVWDIPIDADVKLLEWHGQAVTAGEHIERLYRSMYEVSETPRTAFGDGGRLLSGVALETELRPILQRTMRKRVWWTRALRERANLVLLLLRKYGGLRADPDEMRVRVVWPPMLPRDDAQEVRNQVSLVTAGLRSHRTAMDALGTESPEEELDRVVADREMLGEVAPTPDPSPLRGRGEATDETGSGVGG